MRNKVLIVDGDRKVRQAFEQILQGVVDEGGELIFSESREEGLKIMGHEHPQLVFLDSAFLGENEKEWNLEGVHLVVMQKPSAPPQEKVDSILKPLKSHQVLEKCRAVLGKERVQPLPPM